MPVANIKQATTFNTNIALSFHIIPIAIQPAQPIKDKIMSAKGNSPVDRSTIAIKMIAEELHLIYQSLVSLGVLNLFTFSMLI